MIPIDPTTRLVRRPEMIVAEMDGDLGEQLQQEVGAEAGPLHIRRQHAEERAAVMRGKKTPARPRQRREPGRMRW